MKTQIEDVRTLVVVEFKGSPKPELVRACYTAGFLQPKGARELFRFTPATGQVQRVPGTEISDEEIQAAVDLLEANKAWTFVPDPATGTIKCLVADVAGFRIA